MRRRLRSVAAASAHVSECILAKKKHHLEKKQHLEQKKKERVFFAEKKQLLRLVPVRFFLIPTPPENATRFFQR
jgi:hypothetical protein